MRLLVVLAFASVAFTGLQLVSTTEIAAPVEEETDDYFLDLDENDEEGDLDLSDILGSQNQRGLIASWLVRQQMRKILAQMACGWPKYGIPPLAPYKLYEGIINIRRGFFETISKVFLFRVDGLNDINIIKFKVNLFSKKIKFNFLLPKITITADKYETQTTLDALRELGVYVQYTGDGSLRLVLENLRFAGKMKGRVPIFYGSAKIVSLKTAVTLEKCTSEITGASGNYTANKFINHQIERLIESSINSNTEKISKVLEKTAKDKINPMLEGKDFWSLLNLILTGNDDDGDPVVSSCVPPVDTWDKLFFSLIEN